MTTRATIGGIPLANAQDVRWVQTSGAGAPLQTFTVHDSRWTDVRRILGQFATLEVRPEVGPALVWEKLIPIREVPTATPHRRAFLVSDVRYLWRYEIITRSMNIPRRTGSRRIVGGQIVELTQGADVYGYAYASLDPEAEGGRGKWTPRRAIESVLGELAWKCGHGYRVDGLPFLDQSREVTIEGLDIAENGDQAMNRLTALMPHLVLTVDKRGHAVVFDGTNRDETDAMLLRAGGPTDQGQIDRVVSLDAIRPQTINVYFARELEIRFDAIEEDREASRTVQTGVDEMDDPDPRIVNVLPLPDVSTTIDGEALAEGTYVPIHKAIAAWNDDLASIGKPVAPPALTFENIRRYWFVLDSIYTPLGNLTPSAAQANWVARIAAIRQHYRQTYQIPQAYMQRIRDIRPIRLGVVNPLIPGARAPAQAWSQYCIEPSSKAYPLAAMQNDPDLRFYWLNVDGYPGEFGELHDLAPSPATVEVMDKDLGVLHINYRSDPYGMRSDIHPSLMASGGRTAAPSRDLSDQLSGVISADGYVTGAAPVGLDDSFRVAVVVTCMPFEPNSEGRFYRYEVAPNEIDPMLSSHYKVSGGGGRPWNIVIPPSLMTAWYAITSSLEARESAKLLLGFTSAAGDDLNDVSGYEVINGGAGQGDTPPLLAAFARAVAVAQWAQFVNQREGVRAVHFAPGVEMTGHMESVSHSLDPNGRLITRINMPLDRRPVNQAALIPPVARPIILGTIPEIHG